MTERLIEKQLDLIVSEEEAESKNVVALLIVDVEEAPPKLLVSKRRVSNSQYNLTVPGGELEKLESNLAALSREVLEEVGVDIGEYLENNMDAGTAPLKIHGASISYFLRSEEIFLMIKFLQMQSQKSMLGGYG